MSATLSAGIDSLYLKIKTPMEADGVTPRDDLIGVKVWRSTVDGFDPATVAETTVLAYDGTGLDISITGLTSGTNYYVRYALISEIEPDYLIYSSQLAATPVFETQTVDVTPPPTPSGVVITAGVGSVYIKHDVPTYAVGRAHKRTHVFGLKETPANTAAGYTFANAAAADEIGQFTGSFWAFPSDPDTKWHIWLKWETNNGILSVSPSGGTTGDTATTSQDVSTLLSALYNSIGVSELSTALGNNIAMLGTQYVIKVNAAGQVAGYGLSITESNSVPLSEFGIQADRFWIAPPPVVQPAAPTTNNYNGKIWINNTDPAHPITQYYNATDASWSQAKVKSTLPFVVVTTPQTVNGVTVNPGVYMDAVYIKDGTITDAKIGDATITAAKIGSVDASKITVGKLTADQINSTGLSIKDSAGNLLLDATNSQLGVSLYVGSGSTKKLLSTIGAYASTPNTAYIGEFATAPAFGGTSLINQYVRSAGIITVTTAAAHGFVLGSNVTISLSAFNGTYEIIEIPTSTTFKIVSTGADASNSGTMGVAKGLLYAQNSVYKNTTDGNSYIITGDTNATAAWSLFLEKGKTPVKGTDYFEVSTFDITTAGAAFKKNAAGVITPDTITLATTFSNIGGTPTYQWQKNGTDISGATASTYAVPKADYASVLTNTYKCTITGTVNGTANGTKYDTITIPLLIDGASAIQVINSNQNISFPADNSGYSNITFTGGSSVISAYLGSTALSYAASGANTFSATIATTGATVAAGAGSGTTFTVPAPTAMSADTAQTTVTLTIRDAAGTAVTATTVISYSLSRKGAKGADSTVAGNRGSTWAYIAGRTSWSDTVANDYFTNSMAGGVKVVNDAVTQYGTGFSQTKVWNGASWIAVSVAIDGNLLVKGTVSADSIASGTISVGVKIQSTDGNMVMDFINKTISISV